MATPELPGAGLLGEDRMITTADGRQLRTMVRGQGANLIVLEAGLGVSGLYWGPVHERLAGGATVVAYERAGYGGSDLDDQPRDVARLATDLDAVIDAFPHQRLVLVGHSWGGPIVRVVATRRLEDGQPVDGAVLVDQSDENADMFFTPAVRRQFALSASLMVPLARMGLLASATRKQTAGLPGVLHAATVQASSSRAAARATADEQCHVVEGLRGLRDNPLNLGQLPVRVISGQVAGFLEKKLRATIVQAHQVTAGGLKDARFVPARASGHMVPITEPELVVAEVLSLLSQ